MPEFTQPLLAGDGSAAAPSYTFSSDSNTGMYRSDYLRGSLTYFADVTL